MLNNVERDNEKIGLDNGTGAEIGMNRI